MNGSPGIVTVHAVDLAGEEGIVADAGIFDELGCRALPALTALVSARENDLALVESMAPELLGRQLREISRHERPTVVRTGIFASAGQVETLAAWLGETPPAALVVAPQARLERPAGEARAVLEAVRAALYPRARVVVVRATDTKTLVGGELSGIDGLRAATAAIRAQGARSVLVAGVFERGRVVDFLDDDGHEAFSDAARIAAARIGGLAGAHVAALAAHLARGTALVGAMEAAQRYVAMRLHRGR